MIHPIHPQTSTRSSRQPSLLTATLTVITLVATAVAAIPAAHASDTKPNFAIHLQSPDSHIIEVSAELLAKADADLAKATTATVHSQIGNVLVIDYDYNYDRNLPNGTPNINARRDIALAALGHSQTGPDDHYDFVVTFTTFPVDLGDGVLGLNWSVSNHVQGIGRPLYDQSASFGSNRLQSYIDMADVLRHPFVAGSAEEDRVLDTLMHELMHQWGSYIQTDRPGGEPNELLGLDNAHWSALLSTDASVMYGARWQLLEGGRARAVGVLEQYGPLDLYLAGWLAPSEVPPITLLSSGELDATALPQLGLEIQATTEGLSIDHIIAAEGPRIPNHQGSQRAFRAALVLLKGSTEPVPDSIVSRLERFRVRAEARFAAITLGRANLQLGYESLPPTSQEPPERSAVTACGATGLPACAGGAEGARQWLLANQRPDGSWADKPQTAVRDTVLAVEVLQADGQSQSAVAQAVAWLATAEPSDAEQQALLLGSGLVSEAREAALLTEIASTRMGSPANPSFGAQGSRQPSALETSRVLLATVQLVARGGNDPIGIANARQVIMDWLHDNPATPPPPDAAKCWSRESNGACDFITTAAALDAVVAAGLPIDEMSDHRGVLYTFGDDLDDAQLAEALRILDRLGLAEDPRTLALDLELRAQQSGNGSWADSVPATAQALRWILSRNLPDLQPEGAIDVDIANPVVGMPLLLNYSVRNAGPVEAGTARVLLDYRPTEASDAVPWTLLDDQLTPPLAGGAQTSLMVEWETLGLLPTSYRLRLRVDSDSAVAEVNENNNARETDISFAAAPAGIDLAIVGTTTVTPNVLNSVPMPITVRAEVFNLGQTAAPTSIARLYASRFGQLLPLSEQSISVPAQSRQTLELSAVLSDPDISAVVLRLDDDQQISEANEGNNSVTLALEREPAVDLEVSDQGLSFEPEQIENGQIGHLGILIRNLGTQVSPVFRLRVSVQHEHGPEQQITEQEIQVEAAQSAFRSIPWAAEQTGVNTFTVLLDPANEVVELSESNNIASVNVLVVPSTLPNLVLDAETLTITPLPVRAGADTEISIRVRNNSTVSAPASSVALLQGDVSDQQLSLWTSVPLGALSPGEARTIVVTAPALEGRGDRRVLVVLDPGQLVPEQSEFDNEALADFLLLSRPNLRLTSASLESIPSQPPPGGAARLDLTIANTGEQPVPAATVTLRYGDDATGPDASPAQELGPLDSGEAKVLSFPYVRPAGGSAFILSASVEQTAGIAESSAQDNEATLSVGEVNPSLYVTEPYISPNGDGIRDHTEIVARFPTPQDVRIRIVSSWGEAVQVAEGGALNSTTVASFIWDGKRLDGRRALDDRYTARVETMGGEVLAALAIVVDTNRSPIVTALDTGHQRRTPLGCPFTSETSGSPEISGLPLPALDGVVHVGRLANEFQTRVFFLRATGGEPEVIANLEDLLPGASSVQQIWRVPDSNIVGMHIAVGSFSHAIIELDVADRTKRTLDWDPIVRPQQYLGQMGTEWLLLGAGLDIIALNRFNGALIPIQTGDVEFIDAVHAFGATTFVAESSHDNYNERRLTLFSMDKQPVHLVNIASEEVRSRTPARERQVAYVKRKGKYLVASGFAVGQSGSAWTSADSVSWVDEVTAAAETIVSHESGGERRNYLLAVAPEEDSWILLQGSPPKLTRYNIDSGASQAVDLSQLFDGAEAAVAAGNPLLPEPISYDEAFRAIIDAQWSEDGEYLLGQAIVELYLVKYHYRFFSRHFGLDLREMRLDILPDIPEFSEDVSAHLHLLDGERQAIHRGTGIAIERGPALVTAFANPDRVALWTEQLKSGKVIANTSPASGTSQRDCNQSGTAVYTNAANGESRVGVEYAEPSGAFLFDGLARDLHFERYILTAKRQGTNEFAKTLFAGAIERNGETIGAWRPDANGTFDIELTTLDRAGNRVASQTQVAWFEGPTDGVLRASLSDQWMSPNGDGVKDHIKLEYEVGGPFTAVIAVKNESGDVVKVHTTTHPDASIASWLWDGRSAAGVFVPEGQYRVEIDGIALDFAVDTNLPIGNLETNPIKQCEPNRKALSYGTGTIEFDAVDENLSFVAIEQNVPGSSEWTVAAGPFAPRAGQAYDGFAALQIPSSEWNDFRFRGRAVDHAGNQAITDASALTGFAVVDHRIGAQAWSGGPQVKIDYCGDLGGDQVITPTRPTIRTSASVGALVEGERIVVEYATTEEFGVVVSVNIFVGRDVHPGDMLPVSPFVAAANLVRSYQGLPVEALDSIGDEEYGGDREHRCLEAAGLLASFILPAKGSEETFVIELVTNGSNSPNADNLLVLRPPDCRRETDGELECGAPTDYCFLVDEFVVEPNWCGEETPPGMHIEEEFTIQSVQELLVRDIVPLDGSAPVTEFGPKRFDVSALPVDDAVIRRSLTLRGESNQVIREYDGGSRIVGRDGPEAPVLVWDWPQSGDVVCRVDEGFTLEAEVHDDFLPPNGVRLDLLLMGAEGTLGSNARLGITRFQYPGGLIGLRSVSQTSLSGDLNLFAIPSFVTGENGATSVGDGAAMQLKLSASNCGYSATPSVRDVLIDASVRVTDFRLLTPRLGSGPPFAAPEVGLGEMIATLGLAPLSDDVGVFSLQVQERVRAGARLGIISSRPSITPDGSILGKWTIGEAVRSWSWPIVDSGRFSVDWDGRSDSGHWVVDGEYGLEWSFEDGCGHSMSEVVIPVFIDNSPPIVTITQPASGSPLALFQPLLVNFVERHPDSIEVSYRALGATAWVPLSQESLLDEAGQLWTGHWLTDLEQGEYELRAMVTDRLGWAGEAVVPVVVPARNSVLRGAVVMPRLFSPNDDGILDLTTIDATVHVPALLDIQIEDLSGSPVRVLEQSEAVESSIDIIWDGRDELGSVVVDGTYGVRVHAVDQSDPGSSQLLLLEATVDQTVPEIVRVGVANGFVGSGDNLMVRLDDAHPLRWEASSTSAIPHLIPVGEQFGPQTILSWQGVEEGEHTVRVRAFDAAGNQSTEEFTVVLDLTPPLAVITFPADGALVTRGSLGVEVLGVVEDEYLASWVLEVEGADGIPLEVVSGTDAMDGPLGRWAASSPDGDYVLRLKATDHAGNESVFEVAVTLDNTPPAVAIESPANGAWVSAQFSVNGSVDDAHLLEYQLEIASRSDGSPDWQQLASGQSAVQQALLANVLSPAPDGGYVLRLRAEDQVGLVGEAFIDLEVDITPPSAPLNLTALRQGERDVRLNWSASTASDVVGYRVFRNGLVLLAATGLQVIDLAVPDGTHRYRVSALDRAGNESALSNEASVNIDTTPPEVRIYQPLPQARMRAEVAVNGRAWSREDFERYRLSLLDPVQPGVSQVLIESGNPIAGGQLVTWDSRAFPDGEYGFTLEAWDYSQNRAETAVSFVVDNTPPAAPVGVQAMVDDSDVQLSWQPNSEPDLAGYLIYRGPILLNGNPNADPRSIVYTDASHLVEDLGDGSHDFRVMAVDTTGNVSDPSSPSNAEISGHPPKILITRPTAGTVFEQPVLVRGSSTHQDIVEAHLEYRALSGGAWLPIGAVLTAPPWERQFLPPDLAYGQYLLRARAIDSEGLEDPAPASVQVEYRDLTAPDRPLNLTATVDGGEVSLTWTAPEATDVEIYRLERMRLPQGGWQQVGDVTATALTQVDSAVLDGSYQYRVIAIDGYDNASSPSDPVQARVYTPTLAQPYAPGNQSALILTARSPVAGTAELMRDSAGGSTPMSAPDFAADTETPLPVMLERGLNEFRLRITDAEGNRSKAAIVLAAQDDDPIAPAGLAVQVDDHDVSVSWQANPEDSIRGYRLFRRGVTVLADESLTPTDVQFYSIGQTPYSEPVVHDGDPATTLDLFFYEQSTRFMEIHAAAADLLVALVLEGVADWSLSLSPTLEGYWQDRWIELPADIEAQADRVIITPQRPYVTDRLRLRFVTDAYHAIQVGELTLQRRPLFTATTHSETLPDGAYLYRVSAVNDYGFEGPRSDAVNAEVGDAVAPDPVVLSGTNTGPDVSLSWTASEAPDLAGYRLYRRAQLLFETTDPSARSYDDLGLANGQYDYQVFAFDQVGNASGSNVLVYSVDQGFPATPINLSVSAVEGGGALALQWTAGQGIPAHLYRVKRSTNPTGPFQPVADVPAPTSSHVDQGLSNGTRYYYVVAAVDDRANSSADSNVADGVPFLNQRLATPVFSYPTRFGQSVTLSGPATTLAGTAEPASSLLVGYQGGVLPLLELPAQAAFLPSGYGSDRFAPSIDGRRVFMDYGYTAVVVESSDEAGSTEIELGASCARAQWLSPTRLLHCDDQGAVPRLVELNVANPNERSLRAELIGLRGFRQSADGRRLAVIAHFDWPDGSRESLAWRLDDGALQELAIDPAEIDADLLQFDPSGRWLLLRRLDDSSHQFDLDTQTDRSLDLQLAPRSEIGFAPTSPSALVAGVGPAGQGLYRLNLASGSVEWLDGGLDPLRSAHFDPTGERVHLLTDSHWRLLDWPALTELQQLEVFDADRLHSLATGETLLTTQDGYGEFGLIRPAGVFRLDDVPLIPGENLMTALSQRTGQLNSLPALPITILVPADGLPDLEIRNSDLSLLPNQVQPGASPRIGARVRNVGSGPSTQVAARLSLSTPAGGLSLPPRSLAALAPGEETLLSWILPALNDAGPHLAQVEVDPQRVMVERSVVNNRATLAFAVSGDGSPELLLEASPTLLAPTQLLNGRVQVLPGGSALQGRLRIRIINAADQLLAQLFDQPVSVPAVGVGPEVPLQWTPGAAAAGAYRLQATLFDASGAQRVERELPLTVSAFRDFALDANPQQASVVSGMPIRLDTRIRYLAGNTPVNGASLQVRLETVEGDVLAAVEQAVGTMGPGFDAVLTSVLLPDPFAPAGQYLLRAELWAGSLLAEATAVQLVTDAQGSAQISGSLNVPQVPVPIGQPVSVAVSVQNVGSAAVIGLPVQIRVRRSLQGAPIVDIQQSVDIAAGGHWTEQIDLPAAQLGLGSHLLNLSVSDGPHAGVLAVASFTVVDTLAPALSLVTPPNGSIVRSQFRVDVRAVDQHHPVSEVRVQRAGQSWLNMSPGIDFGGQYVRQFGPLADGPLPLRFDARDAVGNLSELNDVQYIVDGTPPQISISGVSDGGLYNHARTPLITIVETHPGPTQILLGGQPYNSGTPVETEGVHHLYVLARDQAGNEASIVLSFEIDLTPPPIAFTAPANGAVLSTPLVTIQIATEAQAQVTLTTAGGPLEGVADGQGQIAFADVPLDEGVNDFSAVARDLAGNLSAPVSLQIERSVSTVDAVTGTLAALAPIEPPTPIIGDWTIQNLGGLDFVALPLRLQLVALASGSVVAEQHLSVDLGPSAQLQQSYSFASEGRPLGAYQIVLAAQLRDAQGMEVWVELAQRPLQLADLTAPTLLWLSPTLDQLVGATPTVRARLTDALSGIDQAELRLNGGLIGLLGPDPVVPDEYLRDLGPLDDGLYDALIEARDGAGNTSSTTSRFTVDATPPQILITGISDGQLSNQVLSAQIEIVEPHLASSEILLDGLPYVSGTAIDSEGAHELSVSATDQLGNSASRSVLFTLDFTPPLISFLNPPDGLQIIAAHVPALLQSEALASVQLSSGSNQQQQAANAAGLAEFAAVPLLLGDNLLSASATDAAGNRSADVAIMVKRVRPTQAVIEGHMNLAQSVVDHGDLLQGGYLLGNGGGFDPGPVVITVSVHAGADLLAQADQQMLLPPGATASEPFSFDTTGWPLGPIQLRLTWRAVDEPEASPLPIDQRNATLRDGDPPQLTVLEPDEGAIVGSAPLVRAQATDALSAVNEVSVRINGGPWEAMPPTASADEYAGTPFLPLIGLNLIEVRAVDDWDNEARATPLLVCRSSGLGDPGDGVFAGPFEGQDDIFANSFEGPDCEPPPELLKRLMRWYGASGSILDEEAR
jgi:subtilase family serine protease/flagellar hook assembly protein FlgD/fibronectin type 3 domain-containing protein